MQLRVFRIALGLVGLVLLALGAFHTGADILGSFDSASSSNSASMTFMVPLYWVPVALGGAVLCLLSFFIGRRRA